MTKALSQGLELPVASCLEDLKAALSEHPLVLLSAETGSGKTTLVPPALLDAPWLCGRKIVMLEPRRLAARLACEWMAHSRHERPGETIGYRTGQETCVSSTTRIEIMTEGVLTRRVQRDPEMANIGLIIFDEVHERHLATDLGLALVQDVQRGLRPDLRVLLMSATLERDMFVHHFGAVPLIEATGRRHPVQIDYSRRPPTGPLEDQVRAATVELFSETSGDILVFLPGLREIRRCEAALALDARTLGCVVLRLHGDMTASEQDAVLRDTTTRRVILATAVAQSSITIPTVDGVIDAGLMRVARFDKGSGITRLITLPATQDVSDQRAGRAGRVRPGRCRRLWTEADHRGRPRFASPEIEHADLGQLALDLVAWGTPDGAALPWLTPPSVPALQEGQRLLKALDLVTEKNELTVAGRFAVTWGTAPRLSATISRAQPAHKPLACAVAAVLGERDPVRDFDDCSLEARLKWLREHPRSAPAGTLTKLVRRCHVPPWRGEYEADADVLAGLLLFAYRDRLALRIESQDRTFKLASGQRAQVSPRDPLGRASALIALTVEETADGIWIRVAIPVSPRVWAQAVTNYSEERFLVTWHERDHALSARRERFLGALVLQSVPVPSPPRASLQGPLSEAVRRFGLTAIPWTEQAHAVRARMASLNRWQAEQPWPDVSDAALVATVEQWLAPALEILPAAAPMTALDIAYGLRYGLLSAAQRTALERLAPPGLRLRSGRIRPLRYQDAAPPILVAPVQEFYGMASVPAIAGGRVTPVVELLSPAGRPLQVTSDLGGFWHTIYPELRRSLAARYPRHEWPLDPLSPPPPRRKT